MPKDKRKIVLGANNKITYRIWDAKGRRTDDVHDSYSARELASKLRFMADQADKEQANEST